MTTVTRILQADAPEALQDICKSMGFVRADIWRRYGALGTVGKSANDVRKAISAARFYADLPVDGTIRNETTKDIVNDVLLYKAAAMQKVRKAIAARITDEAERKRLYTLLRQDQWLTDNFLHRQMRKHFQHGKSQVANQFIVRSDKFNTEIVNGYLTIVIHIAAKYGEAIRLTTTSSGKNVKLTGSNLRIIVKDGFSEIHYATTKGDGRPRGEKMIGIDKGYTEAFMDSEGVAHGKDFGKVMRVYSDKASTTGKARNKLYVLERRHREAGRIAKADHIKLCNLGRIKIERRKDRTHQRLRTIAYQSAHTIVDKAAVVVSEDLTAPMAKKQAWKQFNRRMSAWAKGVLAEALDSVCTQRQAEHCLVASAYTSQMDSVTGLLEGKRVGDKFYRVNGEVIQADHNAALNVLRRYEDAEITRFTPYQEVRRILLARSPAQLSVNGHELQAQAYQPCADKSSVQICTGL
ncbi:transposase [Acidithiobacillus thiooxidans]|nr:MULTISPECIES: transposase [Acidithiobacillus]MBU2741402.1 transposase [Acidithiobacillus albertensis]OCX67701.1 transposase [Acidithiobacillus thiooxidans]OCX84150.1 transposase [Acidithiobacillus thiooxidans]OCX85789.1 transposase [Acidithiobacillus thiooxidans]OFC48522.1 transposase [Acidithiobacillus thiooxidans]